VTEGAREQGRRVGGMRRRTAIWLASSLCVLSLVLAAVSLLLLALSWPEPSAHVVDYWVENAMVAIIFSTVPIY
jgi:hypothetical protein